jgi:hypothetical protein
MLISQGIWRNRLRWNSDSYHAIAPISRLVIPPAAGGGSIEYQATYRCSEFGIPLLVAVIMLLVAGIALAMRVPDGNESLSYILWLLGATAVAVVVIFASVFRVHHWKILTDGLQIAERPKVPLFGLRRRVSLPFSDITGVHNIESGLDLQIEIIARDGARYRLSQAMKAGVGANPDANLYSFLDAVRSAADRAGAPIPKPSEGLSFWNSIPGLVCLVIMFAIATVFGLAALLAMIEGEISSGPRSGYGTAIALLLPIGAGWLLANSWRRRKLVLSQRTAG